MSHPLILSVPGMRDFAEQVDEERQRQLTRWGDQRHPLLSMEPHDVERFSTLARRACQRAAADGKLAWQHVLLEEVWEALAAGTAEEVATELIQVAAVCQAIIHDLPRQVAESETRENVSESAVKVTATELVVLRGAAMGLDTVGIAQLTGSAVSTVKTHLRRLMTKFEAANRTHLVVRAIAQGVITLSGEDAPHDAQVRWNVEVQGPDGGWRVAQRDVPPHRDRAVAHARRAELAARSTAWTYRVVRMTTTFDLDE